MITLIDKVKTIIDYAKLGMFFCKRSRDELGEFHFPRGYKDEVVWNWDSGYNLYATKITGYVKKISGTRLFSENKPTVEVDLPECIYFRADAVSPGNTTLKIIRLPKMSEVPQYAFSNLVALEYLELGKVTSFNTTALTNCSNLKEFYIKKGSTASLFLYHCPNLTQECLHKLIEDFEKVEDGELGPTFHIGYDNIQKIDAEHIAMLHQKNILYQ